MAQTNLNMILLLRRDDFTAEAKKNYVLLAGEPGYCTATKTFKVGDGSTTWENLDFANRDQIELICKIKQEAYSAEGSAVKTVTGVTQNANGEIAVTFEDIAFPVHPTVEVIEYNANTPAYTADYDSTTECLTLTALGSVKCISATEVNS